MYFQTKTLIHSHQLLFQSNFGYFYEKFLFIETFTQKLVNN